MLEFDFTLYRQLTHSPLEHLAAAANGEELEEEIELELTVEYSVYGSYRPATREEPAEYPEFEIEKVTTLDEEGNSVPVVLSAAEEDEILQAAYEDASQRERDYEPEYEPDLYW